MGVAPRCMGELVVLQQVVAACLSADAGKACAASSPAYLVLAACQWVQGVQGLWNQRQFTATQLALALGRQEVALEGQSAVLPCCGRQQAQQGVGQQAFAGSGRADQGVYFPCLNVQRKRFDHG